jgi:hypothetical protein
MKPVMDSNWEATDAAATAATAITTTTAANVYDDKSNAMVFMMKSKFFCIPKHNAKTALIESHTFLNSVQDPELLCSGLS